MSGDGIGVTSFIRELNLSEKHYESLLHFFRSKACKIEDLVKAWIKVVQSTAPILHVRDMVMLLGDGMKQSKEGKRMPGVKKLHQESENSSKSEYIFGHFFGVVSVLVGNRQKQFAMPLSSTIQDGVSEIRSYEKPEEKPEEKPPSHVVQLITQVGNTAKQLGKSVVILDRYFLSVPALKKAMEFLDEGGNYLLELVTKAKISCTAYMDPPVYCGKGRPRLKGDSVKLKKLFDTERDNFICAELYLYGKFQTVYYYSIDLPWGAKLYKKLRFVLVKSDAHPLSIFVSTCLALTPTEIIESYSYRYKIEISFKALKHTRHFAFILTTSQKPFKHQENSYKR